MRWVNTLDFLNIRDLCAFFRAFHCWRYRRYRRYRIRCFANNHGFVSQPRRTATRQQSILYNPTHSWIKVAELRHLILNHSLKHRTRQTTHGVLIHVSAGYFGLGLSAVKSRKQHANVWPKDVKFHPRHLYCIPFIPITSDYLLPTLFPLVKDFGCVFNLVVPIWAWVVALISTCIFVSH